MEQRHQGEIVQPDPRDWSADPADPFDTDATVAAKTAPYEPQPDDLEGLDG